MKGTESQTKSIRIVHYQTIYTYPWLCVSPLIGKENGAEIHLIVNKSPSILHETSESCVNKKGYVRPCAGRVAF